MSWFRAAQYCRWLSEKEGTPDDQMCYPPIDQIGPKRVLPRDFLSRTGYRLPTEAEWEYSCRAGTVTSYPFGADVGLLKSDAQYAPDSGRKAAPVGLLKPNDLGLFDILGNASEWCYDPFDPYLEGPLSRAIVDIPPNQPGAKHVNRGNSYFGNNCRPAFRYSQPPESRFTDIGFRVARTMPSS